MYIQGTHAGSTLPEQTVHSARWEGVDVTLTSRTTVCNVVWTTIVVICHESGDEIHQ